MNSNTFPQTVYSTPDGWGRDTYYEDEATIQETVASLQELGEGWETVSITDCQKWTLLKVMGDKAAYKGGYINHARGYDVMVFTDNGDGTFEWAGEQYESRSDADELAEMGIAA